MYHDYGSGMWGFGLLHVGLNILFIVCIALGVTYLVRHGFHGGCSRGSCVHGEGKDPNALSILDERFARGEINKEEYEEKRGLLSKKV